MVSGGLTGENVAEALRVTRARGVDVSSSVERAPGVKDPQLIERFIRAVRATQDTMQDTMRDATQDAAQDATQDLAIR